MKSLILFILTIEICLAQTDNNPYFFKDKDYTTYDRNMTGEPKETNKYLITTYPWQLSESVGDDLGGDEFDLDGNDPPPANQNMFRDDCGQWYRKEIFYGKWEKRKAKTYDEPDQREPIILSYFNPCNPLKDYSIIEYRIDMYHGLEWYRTNIYKFIKINF